MVNEIFNKKAKKDLTFTNIIRSFKQKLKIKKELRKQIIMIVVKGHWNPTVIKTSTGTFAVSGSNWVPVPNGTELKDIKWVNTSPKVKKTKPMSWKVKDYTVRWGGSFYSCTCLGYTYRRKCKHITEVSNKFKSKEK